MTEHLPSSNHTCRAIRPLISTKHAVCSNFIDLNPKKMRMQYIQNEFHQRSRIDIDHRDGSSRHRQLYTQGLEAIHRKSEQMHSNSVAKEEAELRQCLFHPLKYTYEKQATGATPLPRRYTAVVERMRKAATSREKLTSLLAPRQSMVPIVPRDPVNRVKFEKPTITVEVTKDGPDGTVIPVGRLTVSKDSNIEYVVAKFARDENLSDAQKKRLEEQLIDGLKKAFPN